MFRVGVNWLERFSIFVPLRSLLCAGCRSTSRCGLTACKIWTFNSEFTPLDKRCLDYTDPQSLSYQSQTDIQPILVGPLPGACEDIQSSSHSPIDTSTRFLPQFYEDIQSSSHSPIDTSTRFLPQFYEDIQSSSHSPIDTSTRFLPQFYEDIQSSSHSPIDTSTRFLPQFYFSNPRDNFPWVGGNKNSNKPCLIDGVKLEIFIL
ncbi:hypothetical protein RRG08_052934 [Elysia crispata]|uniref:Uncharacterized protein n=1 Tax=Elysia crispata TaxID=231223 RepID=A0AAE1EDQ8_9GAST|nr:hypothetical protein RRG08_052934 [Elysia crispata]